MSVDLLLAIAKSFSYAATIASLLSALLIGVIICRVQLGVRSQAQVHHVDDGPGLLGLLSSRRSQMDQRVTRSHPNRAVEVVTQTSRSMIQLSINSCFVSSNESLSYFLKLRGLGLRGSGCSLPQRLIDLSASPQSV